MSLERRADFLCVLGLLTASTLLFADVLFLGNNFYFRDLYQYHMALKRIVHDTVGHGELPLWNRYISSGQPMAANPAYEVFYPPQWLIFLGTFQFGFALHIVAHVWLALVAMYAMLRAIPLRMASSLFGALSFGLGGLMLGAITNLPTFFVWAWAPAIGLTLLRLARAPSASRFAMASVTAAMPLLVTEPFALVQIWFLVMVVAAVYARPRIPMLIAAGAASAVVAAMQLVPLIDLVRHSSRWSGFSYELMTDWSMPLIRPIELLAPRFFGILTPEAHALWGASVFGRRGSPYLVTLYVGVLVAILAMAGLAAAVRGARITAAIAITSYVLAIGGNTPLYRIFYALGIRSIRYPEKFAAMAVVTFIVFAAIVANRIEEGDARVLRIAKVAAWSVTTLLGAWLVVTLLPPFGEWFIAMWSQPRRVIWLAFVARQAALWATLLALGWVVVLVAYGRGHARPALLAGLLLLLLDLGWFANEAVQRMPPLFFRQPQIVQALDRDVDDYALFHRGELAQSDEVMRYVVVSNAWVARNGLRPYVPTLWNLRTVLEPDFDETALLVTHDFFEAMRHLHDAGEPRWSEPFMTMSNVRYVLDYRPRDEALREANGHPEIWRPVRIRRMPNQGRYFFAQALVPARNEAELIRALRHIPDVRGLAFVPWPPFSPAPARLLAARETSNAAELDVEASGQALLVATVTRDAHWHAAIDGAPVETLPANVAYQAIVVPPGRHRIALRYRNPLIPIGAAVSGLALLAAALSLLPRQRRQA